MVSTRTKKDVPIWQPLKVIARSFSPYWIACIPLAAIITIVWNKAVVAESVELITAEGNSEAIAQLQGTLNAIWVLIAAILVIFMNAGFGMLETGFCRQKNAVNILSKNLIVFALATLAYWAIGYSLMFGGPENPFIGFGGWFLSGEPATYGLDPFPAGLPISVAFLFQAAFAGTAATIVSGAVAERIKFTDFIIFSLLLVGISYPITGHWVWTGNGWLGSIGFSDFAGSTVVHSVGGWAALMGAAILGPRMGKYVEGRPQAIPGHNMSIATLGCLILWIGWFGFNPGSQLAADEAVPYIAVTTNLAAAAGGVAATFVAWFKDGKPDLSMIINGILAGLVGITAGCDGVSYFGAVIIGAVAGVIVVYSVSMIDSLLKIDDPVGAVSVHLVNGIWGTLAVGLFNTESGLFYGGGFAQLGSQIVGIVAIGAFTAIFSGIVWTVLKSTMGIRVSPEEELEGLDVGEHGMEAYAGFLKETDTFSGSGSSTADEDVTTGAGI
ncbi:ammonium transporter [Crocosphaera watsonii WH 8501]|uniref:Ammonium transporter n=6 Tax=Crocosphaera TaxID=263510 RepID=Q4CA23_CROWT|nr:ammonium transporter [Crocosphaera watsonii]EAM53113.1 Ammonium transporter [Crocosphaera watsonii WH 8501]EHJ14985.1 Ammonium transporter family [Crocosphaera watsonii WH 0003]CCQ54196.1 Ammonium transporter family [Crocosphaera watsonii WH 0005]CCQ63889.1 Ammonium transporter family [Crocosphaera watsonii WH 0401]CCQ70541.1 Ammonium transporter family [Crocosphaera watsonii WH 0402]